MEEEEMREVREKYKFGMERRKDRGRIGDGQEECEGVVGCEA